MNLNPDVKLQPVTSSGYVYASLVPEDTRLTPYRFQVNPSSLSFSTSANYAEKSTTATSVQRQQYVNSTGVNLTVGQTLFISENSSIKPLLDGITALTKPNGVKGVVVRFVWGLRTTGPMVVTSFAYDEDRWLNGLPARAMGTLTLVEVPALITTAPATPATGITQRQQADGSDAAKSYLVANARKLPVELQKIVQSNSYKLTTNEKGVTQITDSKGKIIMTVGSWDSVKKIFVPAK